MIRFSTLASGSRANSVYVEVDGVGCLLDAGLPYNELVRRMRVINKSPADVKYLFISHAHNDHTRGRDGLRNKNNIMTLARNTTYATPKFFHGFELSHDSPCRGCVLTDDSGNKFAYVPDTGCIPEKAMPYLFDCSALIFEMNYDMEMLIVGPYDQDLKLRICSDEGHMENYDSREVIKQLAWPGLQYLVPFHLSEHNNDPVLVMFEAQQAVDSAAKSCKVIIAKQDEPLPMMTVI